MAEEPLRVAYDLTPGELAPAGVGRYVRDLRAALDRREDVDLRVVRAPLPAAHGHGAARRAAVGAVREGLWYPLGLGRRVRGLGARVLHCPGPLVPGRAGAPWVLTIHDVLPLRHPELFTRANVVHARTVLAPAARRAARVLVGSENTRTDVITLLGVPAERVVVTPWGVDRRFRPVAVDQATLRLRLGMPPGPFVLAVGTLEPRKNLRTLLRAFAEVRRRGVACRLAVVGARGWRTEEIERDLGGATADVVRLGAVGDEDLVALYSSCACFAFPSLHEGVGFPVLEAMACAAPVVAADTTSLPEMVGDAGVLVDPTDVRALADALEGVLRSPARADAMRAAGRRRSIGRTWERCAEFTVRSYREALGEPAPRG